MDLRAERLAAGMSQVELARASGVAQPNVSAYENGRRSPSPDVLLRLRAALAVPPSRRVEAARQEIRAVVAAHHATRPRVFGSVARGEDTVLSDLDLLVEFTDEATLLDEVGLRQTLTDLLHVDVDVVGVDTLRGSFRDRVLREAVDV